MEFLIFLSQAEFCSLLKRFYGYFYHYLKFFWKILIFRTYNCLFILHLAQTIETNLLKNLLKLCNILNISEIDFFFKYSYTPGHTANIYLASPSNRKWGLNTSSDDKTPWVHIFHFSVISKMEC